MNEPTMCPNNAFEVKDWIGGLRANFSSPSRRRPKIPRFYGTMTLNQGAWKQFAVAMPSTLDEPLAY